MLNRARGGELGAGGFGRTNLDRLFGEGPFDECRTEGGRTL